MEHFFLHILQDEKVVNSFVSMMEDAFPGENTYLIIAKDGIPKRVSNCENVISFDARSKNLRQFLSNISGYKHVCLHSMVGKNYQKFIHHSSISWVIWGADLYGPLLESKGYELYYDKNEQYKVRAGNKLVWLYIFFTNLRDHKIARMEEDMISRLSYVITDNGADQNVFMHYFGEKKVSFPGTINYYPIENLINQSKLNQECKGNAIWVGNSAAPNGNHVWVFEYLKNFSKDIKVIAPLSYGDLRIANYVDAQGHRLLGDRFFPLREFLPVNDYYSNFLQANAFVFGHFRQCAVGNILMAFYFGGKVFLSIKNPLLNMYKESGFNIYSIEEDLSEEFAVKPLDEEQRKHNRDLSLSIASYESSIKQLKNVFGKIKTDLS